MTSEDIKHQLNNNNCIIGEWQNKNRREFRSCVKVEVDVLGSPPPFLIVLNMVSSSVDVKKQH